MKSRMLSFGIVSLGLAVTGLLLLAGRMQGRQTDAPFDSPTPESLTTFRDATPTEPSGDTTAPVASTNQLPSLLAQPTVPGGVKLSKGASDIARFAQGGIGQDVMLAYIGNANARFNLGSDQIVYLNDLGVSGDVVKAMIQRDAALDAPSPTAAPTAPPDFANPPSPADTTAYPPAPPMDDPTASFPAYDPAPPVMAADDSQYFYNSLAPYGSWIYVAGCGACWQPTVCVNHHDWRPYGDRGRWVYSNCGWYWQSDYSWGWAAFHYGRWFEDPRCGWVWRPDRTWGPAWVSWRASGEHCGWAPLPPSAHYVSGKGFVFAGHLVAPGFEFGLMPHHYTYVPIARMSDYSPTRYAVAAWETGKITRETKVVSQVTEQNHHVVVSGVDPRQVAALARTEIRQVEIRDVPQTGSPSAQPDRMHKSGGNLVVYRPELPAPVSHPTTVRNGHESYPPGSLILHGDGQAPHMAAPAQPQYTSVNNSAQPHYSAPAVPNQGVSTYVIPGRYTAAQHSSSGSTSPYRLYSTPAPSVAHEETLVRASPHVLAGGFTAAEQPRANPPWNHSVETTGTSQPHVHAESHTPAYSAPAPAAHVAPAPAPSSSSGNSSSSASGKK